MGGGHRLSAGGTLDFGGRQPGLSLAVCQRPGLYPARGQELLWAHDPGSPDQSWTAGTESFASLPSPVQARILEYYRAQGPLYEEQADLSDPALRSEMEAAFSGRSLLFFPEHLEIAFPAGSLPSQEHSYLLGLDWDEELSALLQPWALPYPPENS